jgi:hypothetical protein
MTDSASNTPVTLSNGQTITLAQYEQVTQQVAVFSQQMSVSIEQMSALARQTIGASDAVRSVRRGLELEMAGFENACGDPQNPDNDIGNQIRSSLQRNLSGVYTLIANISSTLDQFTTGLSDSRDTSWQAEQSTLQGFSDQGFNVPAVDPRPVDPRTAGPRGVQTGG